MFYVILVVLLLIILLAFGIVLYSTYTEGEEKMFGMLHTILVEIGAILGLINYIMKANGFFVNGIGIVSVVLCLVGLVIMFVSFIFLSAKKEDAGE